MQILDEQNRWSREQILSGRFPAVSFGLSEDCRTRERFRNQEVDRAKGPSRRPSCELVGGFQSLHGPQRTAAIGGRRLSIFRSQGRCLAILPYHSNMKVAPWMCERGHGVQSASDMCGVPKSTPMLMFIFMHSKKKPHRMPSHPQTPQKPRIYARDAPNNRGFSGLIPPQHPTEPQTFGRAPVVGRSVRIPFCNRHAASFPQNTQHLWGEETLRSSCPQPFGRPPPTGSAHRQRALAVRRMSWVPSCLLPEGRGAH